MKKGGRGAPPRGVPPPPWAHSPQALREQLRQTWNETTGDSIARALRVKFPAAAHLEEGHAKQR